MRAIATGLSDVGLQREHNEDSFIVLSEHDLYIVADGMGGHRAGDVASRLATDTIAEFFKTTAREDVTWPFHFDTSLSEEENRDVHRTRRRQPVLPHSPGRASPDDARSFAHQRLPDGDAGSHRGAEERAPQERHHPRARHARPGDGRTADRR